MTDIAPEGFDLQKALRQQSTTDPRKRKRCPECLATCTPNSDKHGKSDSDYHCDDCGYTFDNPVTGLTEQEVREQR